MPLLLLSLPSLSRSRLRMTILLWLPTKGVLRKLNKATRHASGLPVDKPRPLCRQLWVKERTPKSRGMAPRLCSSAVLLLGTEAKTKDQYFKIFILDQHCGSGLKVFAAKPADERLMLESTRWKEKTKLCKLPSDPHKCVSMCAHTLKCNYKKKKKVY